MKFKEAFFYFLGIFLMLLFVIVYWTRFFIDSPEYAFPMTAIYLKWGAAFTVAINVLIFLLFLLFLPYKTKIEWRSKSVFSAFILALFAEMFGFPLFFFFLASSIDNFSIMNIGFMETLRNILFYTLHGKIIGAWTTLVGMILVFIGWTQIYKSKKFVNTGLYKYIRHPQYTGLILILFGWIIRWPTVITILMFPILVFMYYRLARSEEKEMKRTFGKEYEEYKEKTSMFLPLKFKIKT